MRASGHSVVTTLLHALLYSGIAHNTVQGAMFAFGPGPAQAPAGAQDVAPAPSPAAASVSQPQLSIQSLPYTGAVSGGDGVISGGDGLVGGDSDGSVGADNATAMGSGVVYNGAGQVVSGGSGFGDSHSTYTGKQVWPEMVGQNALLAKAQLKAETGLEVILVPKGSAVTDDYNTSRIRVYYDPITFVVTTPSPSVG